MSRQPTQNSVKPGEVVEFKTGRCHGETDQTSGAQSYQPGSPYKVILIGVAIIVGAFLGFGTWAALAPLDSAAHAPGSLVVESNRKVVQHPDGGVVERITVREGEKVVGQQLLVKLDPTEPQANFNAVRQKLNSALARQARLIAERDGAEILAFPGELTQLAEGGAPQARRVISAARRQFRERRGSLQGQISIQREKIAQLSQKIAGLEAQRSSNERQIDIMTDELVGLRQLYEKGYYPRTRILKMERERARLDGQVGSASAQIAGARSSISQGRLEIEQIHQEFNAKVSQALSETEDEIGELRQRLVVAAQKLDRTAIRAPRAGVVQSMSVHTIRGVVRPGDEIMQIIPVGDRLIIEAKVSPNDIDIVSAGQKAEVRMSALSGRATPTFMGNVVQISADRIVEDTPDGRTRSFYKARIVIPPAELRKLGERKLQAGMPAEVLINTGERTLLDYLLRPITDAISRGLIEK